MGALVAGLWTAALAAQDTNTTVGNPQLKNFQLPGQRTTPPVQPQPQAQPPAAVAPRPAPPTAAGVPAGTAPRTAAPPAARTPARRPVAEPAARAAPPVPRAPAATVPAPAPAAQAPASEAPPPAVAPAPAPAQAAPTPAVQPSSGFGLIWLWLAAPILLVLFAFAFLRRRRAREEKEAEGELLLLAEAPEAAPRPAPEPAAEGAARPWLEVDIEPDRAAATESTASLAYLLVVTNVGDAPARNIRIDTRMFNAADEQEIAAFLGGPIHRHSGSPHVALPPGESLRLAAEIAMKADEVRAIELQGRSIFVPSVAVNVAYDWGEAGEGRTSKSWLVGRKPENPAARMGAFRLDLGPRIYRSVGRRDGKRVMV